ncbi:MAG: ion channel [Pseudomonadota bacterium]
MRLRQWISGRLKRFLVEQRRLARSWTSSQERAGRLKPASGRHFRNLIDAATLAYLAAFYLFLGPFILIFDFIAVALAKTNLGSTRGSRVRRLVSWSGDALLILLAAETYAATHSATLDPPSWWLHATLLTASLLFFMAVVVGVIYLQTHPDEDDPFRVDALRLVKDVVLSSGLAVFAFSYLYRSEGLIFGLGDASECLTLAEVPEKLAASDFLYFSAVSFSTLGFGDFAPCPEVRLAASAQAIYGNLHLGMIAGGVLYYLQEPKRSAIRR